MPRVTVSGGPVFVRAAAFLISPFFDETGVVVLEYGVGWTATGTNNHMFAILRSAFGFLFRAFSTAFLLAAVLAFGARVVTELHARSRLVETRSSPAAPVAIVFGAGLQRDGSASPVLRDRVATAAQLYMDGKVDKLLLSGDNSTEYYNEPAAMREVAMALGVPSKDIVLDFAGRRTYDTCYRAGSIFGVQQALLVTQGYHLPRALYTCNTLAVAATGVPADRRPYRSGVSLFWNLREIPATTLAFWELYVSRPQPVLGEPQPIFGAGGTNTAKHMRVE